MLMVKIIILELILILQTQQTNMADANLGMSGVNYDAFVSSQRTFSDHDFAAKIQEKYWQARQKFLSKVERKEDSCIVLSDTKLDSKLEVYRSIDKSSAKLTDILESYQNCLYVLANEENALGVFLRECSKTDKTKAGKVMAIAGKSLTQSSHQRIRLYMPLVRLFQEMETFHSRAVSDTAKTVDKLESKRSKYRASLLWMKDISEKLNPDVYRELDNFRKVQNQVRMDKKAFDGMQMDVVQKIDLLMASRCNLMNQILAPYQEILLETFEKNQKSFEAAESLIRAEDIYDYEFKALKQLNPMTVSQEDDDDHRDVLRLTEEENNKNLLGESSSPARQHEKPTNQENCPTTNQNLLGESPIHRPSDNATMADDGHLCTLNDLLGGLSPTPLSQPKPTTNPIEENCLDEDDLLGSLKLSADENCPTDDLLGSSTIEDLFGSLASNGGERSESLI